MDYDNVKNFREYIKEATENNVYLRRFVRTNPSKAALRRAYMLATQRDVSEALGYLWKTGDQFGKMTAVINETREAIETVMAFMRPPEEPEKPTEAA